MFQVKLMAVKILNSNGSGYYSWILQGVEYALANGAIISNHSYGGSSVSSSMKTVYNNLANNNPNHLFVYSAGNNNQELNSTNPRFGCALEMSTQICVAASTSSDTKASFSNYGLGMVHVFAPGQSILSTMPNGNYQYLSGTSMASPHVAGLAALIRSMRTMTALQMKDFILDNVQPKSQYAAYVSACGLIDANATINAVSNLAESCANSHNPGWGCCSSSNPCGYGGGDCDNDSHCQSGLICGHERYCGDNWGRLYDCCVYPETMPILPCDGLNTKYIFYDCCRWSDVKCKAGEGGCQSDDDCEIGLVCGSFGSCTGNLAGYSSTIRLVSQV